MWCRGQWTIVLAKEPLCAVFSSPPTSTLELLHCLHPTARNTNIAQSGGRSFYGCTTLATFLSEEESSVLGISGRSLTTSGGGGWCLGHQVPAIGTAKHQKQICILLLCLGFGEGPGHCLFAPCCACILRGDQVAHSGYVLVVATLAERVRAWWR
jgi:hypothetical protein